MLRFAVHRPEHVRVSPRADGMPCREVPGRVEIGVAGVPAGPAPEDGWLSRALRSTTPHAQQRWLVNAGLTYSTRPAALWARRPANRLQPGRRIDRFNPAFCRTWRPGWAIVPRALRVMVATRRSSRRIRS